MSLKELMNEVRRSHFDSPALINLLEELVEKVGKFPNDPPVPDGYVKLVKVIDLYPNLCTSSHLCNLTSYDPHFRKFCSHKVGQRIFLHPEKTLLYLGLLEEHKRTFNKVHNHYEKDFQHIYIVHPEWVNTVKGMKGGQDFNVQDA